MKRIGTLLTIKLVDFIMVLWNGKKYYDKIFASQINKCQNTT